MRIEDRTPILPPLESIDKQHPPQATPIVSSDSRPADSQVDSSVREPTYRPMTAEDVRRAGRGRDAAARAALELVTPNLLREAVRGSSPAQED